MITGGYGCDVGGCATPIEKLSAVEVLYDDGSWMCRLPDLPNGRGRHSADQVSLVKIIFNKY